MKPFLSDTARQLGSVAMRCHYPLSAGASVTWLWGGNNDVRRPMWLGMAPGRIGVKPPESEIARLEALLFLSRQPQTSRRLAQLAGLADGTKARTLVRSLNQRYDAEGVAFRVEEVAGGFQLMTRSKFASWLRRLHAAASEIRLSAPAMETLAVVAYRQPVLRVEIEAVRGVQSGEVLRQLIERNLVRIAGRSEELGRPFLYGTTKQFLQAFGLRHLDELPRAGALRNPESTAHDDIGGPSSDDFHTRTNIHQTPENESNATQQAEEEENVKTFTTKTRQRIAQNHFAGPAEPRRDDRPGDPGVFDQRQDEDEEDIDGEEDEDEEDDEEDDCEEENFDEDDFDDEEEEEEEEEDDEDLDDEPWEEVGDDDDVDEDEDDEDDEDDDWDDDEDWDDEDWDDDEDDWDEDEDDEDGEEEKKKE